MPEAAVVMPHSPRSSFSLTSWIGLVLLLGFLAGCGPDAPTPDDDTLDALSVFPEEVQSVSMVNLQHLKDDAGVSFFGDRGIQLTLLDSDVVFDPLSREQRADLDAFIEASGFDPDTDLSAVYIGAAPMDDVSGLDKPLLVMNATFERDRLAASLHDASDLVTPVDTESDIPVFAIGTNEANGDASNRHIALLDNRRIAVGDAGDLNALLERIDTNTGGFEASEEDRELIGYASAQGSAWSVWLTLPEEMGELSAEVDDDAKEWQQRMARIATVTRQAGLGMTLTSEDVQARLTLVADDNARDVRRLLSGIASGAQSYDQLSEEQRTLVENIAINDEGRFVHIDLNTTQRALAELILASR